MKFVKLQEYCLQMLMIFTWLRRNDFYQVVVEARKLYENEVGKIGKIKFSKISRQSLRSNLNELDDVIEMELTKLRK